MKIIGIRRNMGEYQGRPFTTYWLTVQINNQEGSFGVNTKQISFNSRNYEAFATKNKISDYSKLVGLQYEMEYYDQYRKLVDLV